VARNNHCEGGNQVIDHDTDVDIDQSKLQNDNQRRKGIAVHRTRPISEAWMLTLKSRNIKSADITGAFRRYNNHV
jgi:hypothetical protein